MISVKRKLRIHYQDRGRKKIKAAPSPPPVPPRQVPAGRVPRVARLMALAIRFDRLLREGTVSDQSELARLTHVTQTRMTQIMNLLHLAPDIQEALLFLPRVVEGKDPVTEKLLRPIAAETCWRKQREMWNSVKQPGDAP